ncbi:P-loop containing nucleoside triphosphate hydrolase protein [Chaetomium fimeti]|uniref:P-loop containing nucleoside triphosphate hydrolase protein n=1 Tax=Chaetomium fimeti TaxID=1854472 RepID=A0AAE0LXW6_9PEZI|nr:P-loop containing nucleoside triphosphate hydrolase protein [Chaetomium fimeti]
MFGNRTATAASILQKTYDESYLTCSTAVYYESQGNEGEAMRCWRQALEQIYDHNANRVLPNFTPRSETEKALVDSIRQLELQCKERIDLLEALRLSRAETVQYVGPSSQHQVDQAYSEPHDTVMPKQEEQGWIGNGTIPAVTYTELAKPDLLRRKSAHTRVPSSQKVAAGESGAPTDDVASSSPSRKPVGSGSPQLSPEKKASRASSPERHTMRTTLRSSRLGEKLTKTTLRRPQQKPADAPGAGKAAVLAWGLLGQRDAADQGPADGQELSRPVSNVPAASDSPRKSSESLYKTWDSNSRRLTTPRTRSPVKPSDRRVSADLTDSRQVEGYPFPRPSPVSVSAASSALNSLALRENHERKSPVREQTPRQRTAAPQTPQTRKPREFSDADPGFSDASRNLPIGRKTSSDSAMVSRRTTSRVNSATRVKPARTPSSKSITTTPVGSRRRENRVGLASSPPTGDLSSSSSDNRVKSSRHKRSSGQQREASVIADSLAELSDSSTEDEQTKAAKSWKRRKAAVLKQLPPGVDQHAAKQILNEIIVQGDEVHWTDIAGLEIAKNALRETVVYPFLRPDLFMGLREPARGMLLFGPPGTGKTMLARAVATESKSTFFSISASSLTSKYLGESEKLVRALFALAKVFAPSIIFVDEIDSLLSQRSGSGEHEATRRIKTEFLIQWSDLQRAAAGREVGEKDKERGDANRVLVLAATNLPWAIDEAARRRFVRRQYIPLPEAETRAVQLKTLLKQQKHTLSDADIDTLVGMTDGFSGSDITALAKDAAMGPLRSLGEALLHMTMDEIRPMEVSDFVSSLTTIRPSVSKTGLKEYEDWAREFGERGG